MTRQHSNYLHQAQPSSAFNSLLPSPRSLLPTHCSLLPAAPDHSPSAQKRSRTAHAASRSTSRGTDTSCGSAKTLCSTPPQSSLSACSKSYQSSPLCSHWYLVRRVRASASPGHDMGAAATATASATATATAAANGQPALLLLSDGVVRARQLLLVLLLARVLSASRGAPIALVVVGRVQVRPVIRTGQPLAEGQVGSLRISIMTVTPASSAGSSKKRLILW